MMDRTISKLRFRSLPALDRRAFFRISVAGWASLMSSCRMRDSRTGTTRSFLLRGQRDWVASVCLLCPSACAARVYSDAGKIVAVGGDPDDPNTGGKMCPVGLSVLNLHTNPDRLTGAFRKSDEGAMVPAQSEEIIRHIADRLLRGGSLHIHGRITPFAYYLTKTLGAACSLDEAFGAISTYPSWLNTYGRPPVMDFQSARVALCFDSNVLEHGYPYIGYVRRITEARMRGLRLVTLSPFLTNTATAGEWIPIRSGSAASLASLAIAREALNDPSLSLPVLPADVKDALRSLDGTFLENAIGISHDNLVELTRRFFREPGPAISDRPVPSVLLLNILKGNLNRAGGLLHPGEPILETAAEPMDISEALRDRRNVVVLHRSNPAYSRAAEIRPILRSADRAMVVCVDSFLSETAALSDYVLPLASPLETRTLAEPLPLAEPFLVASPPAAKPVGSCRSLDDWIAAIAAALKAPAAALTPERYASLRVLGDENAELAADRAVYPMKPRAAKLESRMADIAAALKVHIERSMRLSDFGSTRDQGSYFLTTFEESVQGAESASSKWLAEITYAPGIYLHPKRAGRLGIRNGDAVVLSDGRGNSAEGVALLFEGVHPDAAAVALNHGHSGYGRVARGESFSDPQDPDMSRMFWRKKPEVNPAEISGPVVTIQRKQG